MTCPKCSSQNVTITNEQIGGKTKTNNTGCLTKFGRLMLICCTGGLWLLIGKKKANSRTTFKNITVAICQNCGNKWNV